jgi:hypothetical protein
METIAKFVDIGELISGALDREAQRLEDPSSAN